MAPIKVGDRVYVYGWVQMRYHPDKVRNGGRATVQWIDGNEIHVRFDTRVNTELEHYLNYYQVNPKQCRRLKPKAKRRRIWVGFGVPLAGFEHLTTQISFEPRNGYVEFIEVRKKK